MIMTAGLSTASIVLAVIGSGALTALGAGTYKLGSSLGELSAVVKSLEARDLDHDERLKALERRTPNTP